MLFHNYFIASLNSYSSITQSNMTWIVFLFIVTSYIGTYVDGQLCKTNMIYHKHTHTCMTLVKQYRSYGAAEKHCVDTYSGHLVHIFDQETDNFITETILEDNYQMAYIGLTDEVNGVFKWGRQQKATFIGWSTSPYTAKSCCKYVVTTKQGWKEVYSDPYLSICQSLSDKKDFFLLNTSSLENKVLETDAFTKNVFTCRIEDNQNYPIQLFQEIDDGRRIILTSITGTDISYLMHTTCNSSGEYVCQISGQSKTGFTQMKGVLKVRCPASYCPEQDNIQNFAVASYREDINTEICVQVYPHPTLLDIVNDKTLHAMERQKSSLIFTYHNNISTRGTLDIKILSVTQSDYGRYYIRFWSHTKLTSKLYFNITGPPACPRNIISEVLSHDMVRLTWSPVYQGVSEQTFIILKEGTSSDVNVATVSNPDQQDTITYNVTGLSASTNYSFYINVVGGHGDTMCKHIMVSVRTQDDAQIHQEEQTSGGDNTASYIVPIIILIVLIIAGVIIVFVVRRRKKSQSYKEEKKIIKKLISDVSKSSTSQYSDIDVDTSESFSSPKLLDDNSPEVAENIYNNVLENKVYKIARITKPVRKSTSSSVKFKDKVAMETGETQDLKPSSPTTSTDDKLAVTFHDETHIYANTPNKKQENLEELKDVIEQTNTTGKEDDGRTTIQEVEGRTTKNEEDECITKKEKVRRSIKKDDGWTTKKENDGHSKKKDDSRTTKKKDDERTTKKEENGRTVSPQGLVYVSVEINPAGQNPKLIIETKKCNETKPSSEKCKETKPSSETVEYCSLDYLATSVVAAQESDDGVVFDDEQNV